MGPRRIRSGKRNSVLASSRPWAGFNGATANPPWKTGLWAGGGAKLKKLQWGHGESTGENADAKLDRRPAATAPGGPGGLTWGKRVWWWVRLWGRWGLQGAPGESAVENAGRLSQRRTVRGASMGPRRIRRGKLGRVQGALDAAERFNGATANPP